ncbi:CBM1 domain-containing protein [Mycena chlorophos]|uniref:AA9 family lytic polysaccharide monooxygenase n=1 Tax=Mycena chlorophos TaxID=658473 RepID=A0A8H6RWU9_MYCCL|nr:CBM1 domain-containing protein [Mycena chlorophos]
MLSMTSLSLLATVLFGTLSVNAHTIFQEAYVNGVDQGHLTGIRVPDYDGPITDVTSNGTVHPPLCTRRFDEMKILDLICNGGINPYHQPLPNTTITVPAGSQFTAEWHHTLDGADPSDPSDPIDPSHKGPVITYLAQIPNALQSDVTGLKWFKIYEAGLVNPANQTWAVDDLIANKGKVTFTIPECIPAGQYLLRHEIIALHSATAYPGAQFYMECAQIVITGGGSAQPATVSFPGAYHSTDPGITVNIYYPLLTNYTIPGPDVFTCDGTSSGTTTSSSSIKSTTTSSVKSTTTSVSSTKTSSSSAPSTSATGTVAEYGQCGGIGYTGPTTCASPYTCTVSNAYYSQCL